MAVFWSDFSGREGQGVELLSLLLYLFLWLCSPALTHWCACPTRREQDIVNFRRWESNEEINSKGDFS